MRLILQILFMLPFAVYSQWNANAGLVKPFTDNAQLQVSSGENIHFINDGNQHTYWYSSNPLPDRYIRRSDQNIFINQAPFKITPALSSVNFLIDGDSDTKASFNAGTYELIFDEPVPLRLFTLKIHAETLINIGIQARDTTVNLNYNVVDNFKHMTTVFDAPILVNSITIKSDKYFGIFEMAGLSKPPVEFAIIDMNREVELGWINSKHYNISGVSTVTILVSSDEQHWSKIASLKPDVVPIVPILIKPTVSCRYIKYEFELAMEPYNKAELWEVIAYGPRGPFVAPEAPRRAKRTYAESFGINAFWGWGYSVYSDLLKHGQGQYKFNALTKNARNYHRLDWDIRTPDSLPDYRAMANGEGTASTWWMNWNTEYNAWKDGGLSIDASITFKNPGFMDSLWTRPESQAYEFGKLYGKHFSVEDNLVEMVEVGNEPWNYSRPVYQDILKGMSRGLKEADPDLVVIPCAIQAYSPMDENRNYIDAYITKNNVAHISGLNTHIYSYIFNEFGERLAVNPEDPRSETWGIPNLQKYMRINKMAAREVYVTEYGYDSDGGGDDCTHSECVSEFEQAIYGVRKTLILYRMGVAQMYWYYFIDIDYDSFMHNRSGLTSHYNNSFKEKLSFFAFQKIFELLGDQYFDHIIQEDKEAYIYAYSNKNNELNTLVAWVPSSGDHLNEKWISLPKNLKVESISAIVDSKFKPEVDSDAGSSRIKVSGIPVIIKIKPN